MSRWTEPRAAAAALRARAAGRGLAVFLDFDGTLTPIVPRPETARLPKGTAAALAGLARTAAVVVVSGRSLADLHRRIAIDGVGLAGSHGYEIDVPGVPPAPVARPETAARIAEAARQLRLHLAEVPGVLVEPKAYAVAVHWRHVAIERVPGVAVAVEAIARELGELRLTHGKMVFELRPAEEWHKGRAVRWIEGALAITAASHLSVFIGDDVTDLDALEVVRPTGQAVVVGDAIDALPGDLRLADPAAVTRFLAQLAAG